MTDTDDTRAGHLPAQLLGDLEEAIMAHCWATPQPQSVAQVCAALAAARRPLAHTTVMTVMNRLVAKKLLQRSGGAPRGGPGNGYHYWPTLSREEFIAAAARQRVDDLMRMFGDVALAHFAEALSTLDPERLAALRHLATGITKAADNRPITDTTTPEEDMP
jgi:predicted transcriptional regulator